jgi:hypothetical protein
MRLDVSVGRFHVRFWIDRKTYAQSASGLSKDLLVPLWQAHLRTGRLLRPHRRRPALMMNRRNFITPEVSARWENLRSVH